MNKYHNILNDTRYSPGSLLKEIREILSKTMHTEKELRLIAKGHLDVLRRWS